MGRYNFPLNEVKSMIESADTITIMTHLHPDADTLGTGLGIYHFLLKMGKRVEIVNLSESLPHTLRFLPYFHRIKAKIEFEKSLVISCDCGTLSRLGTTLNGREILNIDHHVSNTMYGSVNIVDAKAISASQVAYGLFSQLGDISKESAICFYTALLSDSCYFTTNLVNQEVFGFAQSLIALGVDPAYVAKELTQKRSLSSIRILAKALSQFTLLLDARVGLLWVDKSQMKESGATMVDIEGIVEYARSLASVEIGIFLIEFEEGIRVSLRSKEVDVSTLAAALGGGGHPFASGIILRDLSLEESKEMLLENIKKKGILDEKTK